MTLHTRREVLTTLAVGGAALVAGCAHGGGPPASAVPSSNNLPSTPATPASPATATDAPTLGDSAMPTSMPTAFAATHTPMPLPFAAGSLNGLSEKMITSHHENNYGGAVKNLNGVEKQLAQVTKDTPPFVVVGLHERELTFRNSKTLHEAYFANLGGDGKRSGSIESALAQTYGTSSRWEEHFRLLGAGLGGGSGWAILSYELDTGALRTCWSGGHTQVLATSLPLLVMDMYEHAYQMDFGAAAARYIDAFFANIKWDEVNARLEHATRINAAWKGKAA